MTYIFLKRKKLSVSELFDLSKKRIAELFNLDASKLIFEKNENGKPYLKDDILFISGAHSGDITVLAVGTAPLGIDIEKEKDIDYYMLAKRLFPKYDINSSKELFKLWAGYEAVLKRMGKLNLASFDNEQESLFYFDNIEGYTLALSSINKEFAFVIM